MSSSGVSASKLLALYLVVTGTDDAAIADSTAWLSPPTPHRVYRDQMSSSCSTGCGTGGGGGAIGHPSIMMERIDGRHEHLRRRHQKRRASTVASLSASAVRCSIDRLWLAVSGSYSDKSKVLKRDMGSKRMSGGDAAPSLFSPWVVEDAWARQPFYLGCSVSGECLDTSRESQRGEACATGDLGSLLSEEIGLSPSEVQDTLARCEGLGYEAAAETVAFFCGSELGLTAGQMHTLVLKAPQILEMSVPDQLIPQADRWLNSAGLGLTRKALGRITVRCPEVFLLDYDSVLAPIIVWLLVDVRIARNRVGKFLEVFPYVLAADLVAELRPRHRWLTESLQLADKDARRVLSLAPKLLNASLEDTLLPACDWIMAAGQCDMGGVGRISTSSPELLLMDPEAMSACLSTMADEVFGGDEAKAVALFVRQPVLLAQSHRLQPVVALMVEELKATLPEAIDILASDPSITEFQLENVVLPRLETVRKAGIGEVVNGAPISMKGKMKVLGKFSRARFAKWLKREGRPQTSEAENNGRHRGGSAPAAAAVGAGSYDADDSW